MYTVSLTALYRPFIQASSTQGFARHSKHDVNLLLQDDLQALSIPLGRKAFLLGDMPCDADAAVFAILDMLVSARTVSPELNGIAQQYPKLCQYTRQIHDQYFPEGPLAQAAKGKKV